MNVLIGMLRSDGFTRVMFYFMISFALREGGLLDCGIAVFGVAHFVVILLFVTDSITRRLLPMKEGMCAKKP